MHIFFSFFVCLSALTIYCNGQNPKHASQPHASVFTETTDVNGYKILSKGIRTCRPENSNNDFILTKYKDTLPDNDLTNCPWYVPLESKTLKKCLEMCISFQQLYPVMDPKNDPKPLSIKVSKRVTIKQRYITSLV